MMTHLSEPEELADLARVISVQTLTEPVTVDCERKVGMILAQIQNICYMDLMGPSKANKDW